jgi:Ca2+-binding EF-hand superfamily protein
MEAIDANGDGTISAAEISAASEALAKLDENGDGQLTDDELRPNFGDLPGRAGNRAERPGNRGGGERRRLGQGRGRGEFEPPGPPRGERPGGPPEGPPGPGRSSRREPFDASAFADRILSFDKNDDGQVTSEELPKRMRAMIDRGDTSQDGSLDREEIEALAEGRY